MAILKEESRTYKTIDSGLVSLLGNTITAIITKKYTHQDGFRWLLKEGVGHILRVMIFLSKIHPPNMQLV